ETIQRQRKQLQHLKLPPLHRRHPLQLHQAATHLLQTPQEKINKAVISEEDKAEEEPEVEDVVEEEVEVEDVPVLEVTVAQLTLLLLAAGHKAVQTTTAILTTITPMTAETSMTLHLQEDVDVVEVE